VDSLQEQRKYRAFISYRHTAPDKPIAIALQQQLERYKVPGYLRRQGFPSKLGYVFRDEADLPTSSDLGRQIEEALDSSDYLIVVCSTNTPHSRYVAAEIDYFKKKNGDHKCLALLVEGEPSSQKVFPDELVARYDTAGGLTPVEPIAADVRADTLSASLKKLKTSKLKIIAGLLGCNYDDLVRRQRERRLKTITAVSLAAALFLIGFGIFMIGQLSIVNENQRKTQLAYAEQSLTRGNRVLAMEQAIAAMKQHNTLFSDRVSPDTRDSLYKASVTPAFSLFTQIDLKGQIKNGSFTPDGKQILVQSDLWLRGYDPKGGLLWEFTVAGKGDRIAAVSPDGGRAAVVKNDQEKEPPTVISLWDTHKNTLIGELPDNSIESVVSVKADFSPDGRYVCTYRSGGYFNTNEAIRFWDASTGQPVSSFDAACLGTRRDGGQGSIVAESRYEKSGVMWLKGSANYVYLRPGQEKAVIVPLQESPSSGGYASLSKDKRFGAYMDETGQLCIKDRSSQKAYRFSAEDGKKREAARIEYIDWKYAIVPVRTEGGAEKRYAGIDVVDLESMKISGSYRFSDKTYDYFKELTFFPMENSDRVYLLGTDGLTALKTGTFEKNCSTLLRLDLPLNRLELLCEDVYYLNEGVWTTTRLDGSLKDFIISRNTDKNGEMRALELDTDKTENLNLYYLPDGGEFDPGGAQINAGDQYLLVKENTSLFIYSLVNRPGTLMREPCEAFADCSGSSRTATYSAGLVKMWENNKLLTQLPVDKKDFGVRLSEDGEVLLGIEAANEIIVWNAADLSERCRIKLGSEDATAILSPDGSRIAVLARSTLELYDSVTGKLIRTLHQRACIRDPESAWSGKLAFSPDGRQLACLIKPEGGEGNSVCIWDAQTGAETGLVPANTEMPADMDNLFYSKDGMQMGVLCAGGIWIWDLNAHRYTGRLQEEGTPQIAPYMDSNAGILATGVNGSVHIWNLTTGRIEKMYSLEDEIWDFSVSPENRWLTGTNQKGVWLFDLDTGECAGKILNECVLGIESSDQGQRLNYYAYESGQFCSVPYLYEKPDVICQQWLMNKE
jgi:WD40 repeat protein